MATIANKIITPPLTGTNNENLITILENNIQATIPNELKQFLLNYNEVIFERKEFTRVTDNNFSQVMTLERIMSISSILESWEYIKDEDEFKEKKLLPFGETLGSPFLCIGIDKDNYGTIYIFDYDFGLITLSHSLNEFIQNLK